MSVMLEIGETVMFSVQAADHAGNTETVISPPLTIDTTAPLIREFTCNKYLSKAQSMVRRYSKSPLSLAKIFI